MDKVLKQRLVGASILIALAVIFLPMLFNGDDGEPTQRQLTLDLPERPSDSGRDVRRLPLDPDEARQPSVETLAEPPSQPVPEPDDDEDAPDEPERASDDRSAADSRETEAPATSESARPEQADGDGEAGPETEPEPEPETESDPEPEGPTAADPEPVDTASDGDWVVQVAVFSNRESADRVSDRLDGLGHEPRIDVLTRDEAELFRLRAGPYTSRGDADRARSQIAATVAGVEPVVRSLDGGSEGASSQRSGYSVQVGSFASKNNAERLVARVREYGHEAFMHEEDSSGRTIWRVRAGLFEDRESAEGLLDELRSEAGLDGIVVSHP